VDSRRAPRACPSAFQEGRSRFTGPDRPIFGGRREIPAPRKKFPAHSLLDAKKFPARPRREFCRKTLKSKAVSAQMSAKRAEFPANSLPAGNFIDSIWIAGMTTIERLGS
jgi:hypothetical protein